MANDAQIHLQSMGASSYVADDGALLVLDELAGASSALDSLRVGADPTANHGTPTNVTFGVTGKDLAVGGVDRCAYFSRASQSRIVMPANLDYLSTLTNRYTISMRLRLDSVAVSESHCVFSNLTGGKGIALYIVRQSDTEYRIQIYGGTLNRKQWNSTNTYGVGTDVDMTITVVCNGNSTFAVYVNGVAIAGLAVDQDLSTSSGASTSLIIGDEVSGTHALRGWMSHFAVLPYKISAKEAARLHTVLSTTGGSWVEEDGAAELRSWLSTRRVVAFGFGDSRTIAANSSWWDNFALRGVAAGVIAERLAVYSPASDFVSNKQPHISTVTNYTSATLPSPFDFAATPVADGLPRTVLTHSAANQASGTQDCSLSRPYGDPWSPTDWPNLTAVRPISVAATTSIPSKIIRSAKSGSTVSTTIITGGVDEPLVSPITPGALPASTSAGNLTITMRSTDDDETSNSVCLAGFMVYSAADATGADVKSGPGMMQLNTMSANGWQLCVQHLDDDTYTMDGASVALALLDTTQPSPYPAIFVLQADVNDLNAGQTKAAFKAALLAWIGRVETFCANNSITDYRMLYAHSWWRGDGSGTHELFASYFDAAREVRQTNPRLACVSLDARFRGACPRQYLINIPGSNDGVHIQADTFAGAYARHKLTDTLWDIIAAAAVGSADAFRSSRSRRRPLMGVR